MKLYNLNSIIILLIILSITHNSYSQDQENKWVIGLGANAVDFFPTSANGDLNGNYSGFGSQLFNSRDHWSIGVPKVHLTRHIKSKFAVDVSFVMNELTKIGKIKTAEVLSYKALDATVQYSFLKDNYKYYPYALAGGGYTWIDNKGVGTFEAGLGMTYWFSNSFGVNFQGMYKIPESYPNVIEHFHYSLSVVHRFGKGRRKGVGTECFE